MKIKNYLILAVLTSFLVACSAQQTVTAPQDNSSTVSIIRTWLEIISFASAPLLLIAAIVGLRQLEFAKSQIEVTKELSQIQAKRVSYEAAVNECRNFSEKMIPILEEMDKYIAENKITLFKDVQFIENDERIELDFSKAKKGDPAKLAGISHLISNYFNGLELFALYFVSEIADEDIAFLTMGNIFVNEVKRLMIIMAVTKTEQDDCKAIWPLYFSWKERIKEQNLEKEKFEIETRRFEIDKELKKTKYETRKPIGTH